jgi:hypothetical protein
MKKFSVLVKQVLMSTLTAGVFTFSLTACSDDNMLDNECEPFCYAFPKRGHGPQTIKICTIDNTNTESRSGELIVNDLSGDATSVTLTIKEE